MRAAAVALVVVTGLLAGPALAQVTAHDLLIAARCIGGEEGRLAVGDHIISDPRRAENLDYAFSTLLTLRQSPPETVMQKARKAGQLTAAGELDPFSSVSDIMAAVNASADCVAIIDRLGLLPVVYPGCFPDGCPPQP